MATTPTIVREALASAISALVPAVRALDGFQRYEGSLKFEKHCERDPAHAFRRYYLEFKTPPESPDVVNGASGRWRYPFSLTVGYPAVHYKDLSIPRLELDDARDTDFALLIPILRDFPGASFIASEAEFSTDADDERPVTYLRFELVYEFFRQV